MRAAAFDLSSETGGGFLLGWGAAPTMGKKRILNWDRDIGLMLEGWRLWLGRFFDEHDPQIVGVEAPAHGTHGDMTTIERQAMIRGSLHWACHIKQVPIYSYAPSQWRKTFIGFGSGPRARKGALKPAPTPWKALAKARCRALGWDCQNNHNVAEAGGVLAHLLNDRDAVPVDQRPPWSHVDGLILPLPEVRLV